MSRCVRRGFAAAACVLAAVVILGSCSLGFLGDSFTLEGQLYAAKEDVASPLSFEGTIGFVMEGRSLNLASGAVTGGAFSVTIPGPPETLKWNDMLPPVTPTLMVSDGTIEGYLLNKVTALEGMSTLMSITRTNVAGNVLVWYMYTESDVDISGTGRYNSPFGDSATIDIDITLKTGWNRVVVIRTGSAGAYTDTWAVGDEPDGLFWLRAKS